MTTNLSRRALLAIGTATTAGMLAGASTPLGAVAGAAAPATDHGPPDAVAAWQKLVEGNARFMTGAQIHPHEQLAWRETLLNGQHPFACVLGCADSRVSPELVFDHGFGDLFTVRTVGEVLDDSIVGSIEYAVEHLHVPLVVVLGHAGCGAVQAAIDLVRGSHSYTGAVDTVARAIEATVLTTPPDSNGNAFLLACVRNQASNVRTELVQRSSVIREAVARHRVTIAAAVYDLKSGQVRRLG